MTTPFFGPREAQPLDVLMQQGGAGWNFFAELGLPRPDKEFQPPDLVAKFLAATARQGDGRQVIEWLMDITLRAPLRVTGKSVEETALLAATRQGINGVGEAVLAAIRHGEALLAEPPRTEQEPPA